MQDELVQEERRLPSIRIEPTLGWALFSPMFFVAFLPMDRLMLAVPYARLFLGARQRWCALLRSLAALHCRCAGGPCYRAQWYG